MGAERRTSLRVPVEIYMTQFVDNRPFRSVISDLSVTGLYTSKLVQPMSRSSRVVQLELPLPGIGEPLWAKAEVIYDALDPLFHGMGLRFLAMAPSHESKLAEWIEEARRVVLGRMMAGISDNLRTPQHAH